MKTYWAQPERDLFISYIDGLRAYRKDRALSPSPQDSASVVLGKGSPSWLSAASPWASLSSSSVAHYGQEVAKFYFGAMSSTQEHIWKV